MSAGSRLAGREVRHRRIRRVVRGAPGRPRLVVFRSLKHIYAQIVDDDRGVTLAAAGGRLSGAPSPGQPGGKVAVAKLVGEAIARKAREKGIGSVVFDRGGYQYHGRVKALAEAARAAGLVF